jgi:hypothetical protein
MIDRQSQELARHQELSCIECAAVWVDATERWRIYLTDDEPQEPVLYCYACATYEFGP